MGVWGRATWRKGRLPVLAEGAEEVAPHGAHGEDAFPGVEVVEGLLLHRVQVKGGRLAVGDQVEPAPEVAPHPALARPPFGNGAVVGAGPALHVPFGQGPDQVGLPEGNGKRHSFVCYLIAPPRPS